MDPAQTMQLSQLMKLKKMQTSSMTKKLALHVIQFKTKHEINKIYVIPMGI